MVRLGDGQGKQVKNLPLSSSARGAELILARGFDFLCSPSLSCDGAGRRNMPVIRSALKLTLFFMSSWFM
jgi:hypothetical protein